ncbi:MAG TPA: hypothetical protein VNR61_10965 [Niallia sp.]|nr:hypothetical protein [Niallia sp.]
MITATYLRAQKHYNGKIRCPDCHESLFLNDYLKLSNINTLSHVDCCQSLPVKDVGSLRELIKKYPDYFPLD